MARRCFHRFSSIFHHSSSTFIDFCQCLAAPNGRELRLELIDEPLKAPKGSEEVSTLIQTALTFRRLKHYDQAMALLIRARKLWAMQAAV